MPRFLFSSVKDTILKSLSVLSFHNFQHLCLPACLHLNEINTRLLPA
jgi:hypothetical protein